MTDNVVIIEQGKADLNILILAVKSWGKIILGFAPSDIVLDNFWIVKQSSKFNIWNILKFKKLQH